jgi:hypothetical protein
MSLDAIRGVALAAQVAVTGVAIAVTRPAPDDLLVATTGIWLGPLEETRPMGTDFQRTGARKAMAVPKTASLPNLPRGTLIVAPEEGFETGPLLNWRVDGYLAAVDPDLMRVVLIPMATKDLL